jgi:hypothetical protein
MISSPEGLELRVPLMLLHVDVHREVAHAVEDRPALVDLDRLDDVLMVTERDVRAGIKLRHLRCSGPRRSGRCRLTQPPDPRARANGTRAGRAIGRLLGSM